LCSALPHALCDSCRLALAAAPRWSEVAGKPLCTTGMSGDAALDLVRAFKDQARLALAQDLSLLLGEALKVARKRFPDADALVTPPSTWSAWRRRGFRPLGILLKRAGYRHEQLLQHVAGRRPRDQRGLTTVERRRNVQGTMTAHARSAGKQVILVDDVVTTGATASEAIRALELAGARVLCVVALTRVEIYGRKLSVNG
jgi:predicted amidophosphoribosyltransferase